MMSFHQQLPTPKSRLAEREASRDEPVVMRQRWRHLLFLHWRWDPMEIQARLPEGLTVDTFDGLAWLGVTPFFVREARLRWTPPIPCVSNFPETNVRTYVHDREGRPGVWFFSLDAGSCVAALAARIALGLPYRKARMPTSVDRAGNIEHATRRCRQKRQSRFGYRSEEPRPPAEVGTLEFFLIERYLLFTVRRGELLRTRVSHLPYPLSEVTVSAADAALLELDGFPEPQREFEHALYSIGVDVEVHAPRRADAR